MTSLYSPFRYCPILATLLACCVVSHAAAADAEPLTVFVFAGQSNMVGKRSKAEALPKAYQGQQSDVILFDGRRWVAYRAGLGQAAGFGPEVSAALELSKALRTPIGIIKHSVGGANLAQQWHPSKEKNLYTALRTKVAAAGKSRKIKIAGAFWMQGGADAKSETKASAYAGNLDQLIAAMRRDFGNPDMPFVAGRSGRGSGKENARYPSMGIVRAAQEQPRRHYAWVDCDQITVGSDKIHYDTPGVAELGRRMSVAMNELLTP